MSVDLNSNSMVLWFDDLGTGNEAHRFLSNFYVGEPIVLPTVEWQGSYNVYTETENGRVQQYHEYGAGFREGWAYPHNVGDPVEFMTGEHAFQAMKCNHIGGGTDFSAITHAHDPSTAKALGRSCDLRPDWEQVKYDVMCAVVRSKFTLQREEGVRLLETGDKLLVEGTWWKDTVWGVDLKDRSRYQGRNWLGTILMARRAELRAMQTFDSANVKHFVENTATWNAVFGGR